MRNEYEKWKVEGKQFTGEKMGLSRMVNDIKSILVTIVCEGVQKRDYTIGELGEVLPNIIHLEGDELLKIEENVASNDIKTASSSNFMKQLLHLSGIDVNLILGPHKSIVVQQIESAEIRLSEILAEYWTQEKILIKLRREYDAGLPEEITNKHKLYLDIEDSQGHRTSIKDQSPGFQWFLSFTIKHLIGNSQHKSILLMLDEPGIHLSLDAQTDLLERFEDTNDNVQILYTTHSPYMLNKNFPYRIRLISKGGDSEGNEAKGTQINNKPYHSKRGRAWEPIRTGIGLSTGASLFLAGRNLIVEGISDQILIASVIQSNQRFRRIKIDLNRVCICFAGNNSVVPMALFALQETGDVKVILDSDNENVAKQLRNGGLAAERIFVIKKTIGEASKDEYSDIESLFTTEYYHKMFIRAYKSIPNYKPQKGLPSRWDKIAEAFDNKSNINTRNWGRSKYYAEYFKHNSLGGFDKTLVAKTIAEDLISSNPGEIEDVTKHFMTFLKKVWSNMNWLER